MVSTFMTSLNFICKISVIYFNNQGSIRITYSSNKKGEFKRFEPVPKEGT